MASAPLVTGGTAPAQPMTGVALSEAATGITNRLLSLANEQVRLKKAVEDRWLDDLRAYHGRYDVRTEQILNSAERLRSQAFINITRAKTNGWAARIGDLLFPADDKNWGIQPTPVPELATAAKHHAAEAQALHREAADKVDQANQAGEMGDTGQQGAHLAAAAELGEQAVTAEDNESRTRYEMEEARKRAESMEAEIDDQLTECRYPSRCRAIVEDAAKIGSGIIKGPNVASQRRARWTKVPSNPPGGADVFQMEKAPDPRPDYRRVNPWSFFPQMTATSMEDCEFTFERHLPTKGALRKLANTLDFDPDVVKRLLEAGPDANGTTDLRHLNELRSITNEGEAVKDRYVLWEYHGPLEGEEICTLLRASGQATTAEDFEAQYDPLDETMVVAYFCGAELLKLHPEYSLDSGENLYSVYAFEKGEASVLGGIGVPRIIRDGQKAANAAWRMMLDNGALAVGPQIVVDKSKISPENGVWTMSAMKIWLAQGLDVAQQAGAPFQVFNIPMNQTELAGIIQLALQFIDEEASLPTIAQGEQGQATQTMGGMSMLFNSANVVFRRVVRNFDDDLTTPVIRRAFDWNMQFNKNEDIKGDMQIEARGTSVLLVREMMAQQLAAIVMQWPSNPTLSMMLKNQGYDAARQLLQSLSMSPDTILCTSDEFQEAMKKMAEASAGQESPDKIRADASIKVAEITAKTREAEGNIALRVAEIHRETELTKLASDHQLTLEQLKTQLGIKKLETDSKERIFAGEVGAETAMAAEARAHGQKPQGSGGYVNEGVK